MFAIWKIELAIHRVAGLCALSGARQSAILLPVCQPIKNKIILQRLSSSLNMTLFTWAISMLITVITLSLVLYCHHYFDTLTIQHSDRSRHNSSPWYQSCPGRVQVSQGIVMIRSKYWVPPPQLNTGFCTHQQRRIVAAHRCTLSTEQRQITA